MRKFKYLLISASFLMMSASLYAGPTTYSGVTFPEGDISFADAVYSYAPGTDVGSGWNDPTQALGAPNYSGSGTAVSLGNGGALILQFTDNSLTTSGDSAADLHVFEVGSAVEWMNIAISTSPTSSWIDLGDLKGQPTSIDIDAVAGVTQGTKYSYVRILDIPPNQSGSPYGEADIDAVGAISSAAPVVVIPVPGAILLVSLGTGLVGLLRRRGAV